MVAVLDKVCSPRVRRYGFWSLIALLTALTVHDVYVLVDEYLENPKQVDMMVIFNETMTFPNITLCGEFIQFEAPLIPNVTLQKTWFEDFNKSIKKFKTKKQFLKKDWDIQVAYEAMAMVSYLTSVEVEFDVKKVPANIHWLPRAPKMARKNNQINTFMKLLKELDVTYAEFYQKTGEEVLTRSLHQMRRFSQSDEHSTFSIRPKITWISQLEFCFQPTFFVDDPIKSQGQYLFAQFKVDLEKLLGKSPGCMSADLHGRPSGHIRNMGHSAEKHSGYAGDICFGQYIEIRTEVKNVFEMQENDTPGKECEDLFVNGKNTYDCRLRCRIDYIRSLCKCTPMSLTYLVDDELELNTFPMCNYSECTINVTNVNLEQEAECLKGCKRDCHQVRYIITPSDAKKTVALTNKNKQIIKRELITMSFIWGSFEYIGLQEDWKYSPVAFISELGGAIGVYLGLSVLTLVVGLIYSLDMGYQYFNDYVSDRKQTNRAQNSNDTAESPKRDESTSNGVAEK